MTNDNVMHAIDLGVAALRDQVADLKSQVAAYKQVKKQDEFAINQRDENIAKRDEQLVFVRKQRQEAESHAKDAADAQRGWEESSKRRTAEVDRLTLQLYLFIKELIAARDTARVKSTQVALGHIVERLRLIRDPSGKDGHQRWDQPLEDWERELVEAGEPS